MQMSVANLVAGGHLGLAGKILAEPRDVQHKLCLALTHSEDGAEPSQRKVWLRPSNACINGAAASLAQVRASPAALHTLCGVVVAASEVFDTRSVRSEGGTLACSFGASHSSILKHEQMYPNAGIQARLPAAPAAQRSGCFGASPAAAAAALPPSAAAGRCRRSWPRPSWSRCEDDLIPFILAATRF